MQGVPAPIRFLIFLVSLALILRTLVWGVGYEGAAASVVVKTAALYLIMVTGAIWEKVVFGQYLFEHQVQHPMPCGLWVLHVMFESKLCPRGPNVCALPRRRCIPMPTLTIWSMTCRSCGSNAPSRMPSPGRYHVRFVRKG